MKSLTIDFGIDLGTSNSKIARINGVDAEVIKNSEGFEFTPSVVWIDSKERVHVGRRAKDQLENDPENAFSEFKIQMGTETQYTFERNKKKMSPYELSAEVLKALKEDVRRQLGEEVTSVVITVPAAFELPHCQATNKAAKLAGFVNHPLLQEPIAAAMAYGFQNETTNKFWMVYDFGGGKFDASIIQIKDGQIEIIHNGGDNGLGGKNLDREIVNSLLAPAIAKEHNLKNFTRNNKQFWGVFAKLNAEAEKAKIRLSLEDSVKIYIDTLFKNDKGEAVEFTYELSRSDFEKLAKPYIIQSINICKKVLMEKRLGTSNIEKMIMVGGTSLIPYLRNMLLDANQGLGIPLESNIYPITVVAKGAAIFASTKQISFEKTSDNLSYICKIESKIEPNEHQVKKECDILIETATPNIYRNNAFRISRLNVSATTREISNQVQKNQMLEKYDGKMDNHKSPFPIEPPPDVDKLRQALHRLRDPETRMIDEFFWFWPLSLDNGSKDDALDAISRNDSKTAEKIWRTIDATQTESIVSQHNLAVLSHLSVLDIELNGKTLDEEEINQRDSYWKESFKSWKLLLEQEGLWSKFDDRVRRMDDPRLTRNFVNSLKETLPVAILQINAFLALKAAEAGNMTEALRQISLMRGSGLDKDVISSALKNVASTLIKKNEDTSILIDLISSSKSTPPPDNNNINNNKKAQAPTSRIDLVHFSVSSPPAVQPGRDIIVDVWAHLEQQRTEVANRVKQASIQTDAPPVIRPKGPFKIERGTILVVRLKFQDLIVEPAEDVILWEGEIGNASYVVSVPAETAEGVRIGSVTVHCEEGLQIARIPLQLMIKNEVVHCEPIEHSLHRVRKAFVSYARADLDEVLSRIQGMQKIIPDLDVFLDVVKLRSGEDWEKRLWTVIPESDVFYLFWSAAAKESLWVEKEWRCALTSRGVDFIDPVPLVSPKEVPPPVELSKMHFNDWSLAYRRGNPDIT
ncbi:MAG: Hsp70 family protein [Bacteroidales bacterium]|nr:Hsp70 family protein [Bacteroidales bacterium]